MPKRADKTKEAEETKRTKDDKGDDDEESDNDYVDEDSPDDFDLDLETDKDLEDALKEANEDDNKNDKSEKDSGRKSSTEVDTEVELTECSFNVKYKSIEEMLKTYKNCDFIVFVVELDNRKTVNVLGNTRTNKMFIKMPLDIIDTTGDGEIPISEIPEFMLDLNELKGSEEVTIEFNVENIKMSGEKGEVIIPVNIDKKFYKSIENTKKVDVGIKAEKNFVLMKKDGTDIILDSSVEMKRKNFVDLIKNSEKLKSKFHMLCINYKDSFYKHAKRLDILKNSRNEGVTKIVQFDSIDIKDETRLIFDENFFKLINLVPSDEIVIDFLDAFNVVIIHSKDRKFISSLFPC